MPSTRTRLSGESLESRQMLAAIDLTDHEQLLIELVNRSRANPAAEAARFGVDLNEGVDEEDWISPEPKQPVAPHQALIASARGHSTDMLVREFFDHDNPDGEGPSDRARRAGYPAGAGENIAWFGSFSPVERIQEVYRRHEALFLSPSHRINSMNASWRELGTGIRFGTYDLRDSIMVTENFGNRGGDYFITGVAYVDSVLRDNFYSVGEGLNAVSITARRIRDGAVYTTTTGESGGYTLQVPSGVYTVVANGGELNQRQSVSSVAILNQNQKVDFVKGQSRVGSISGLVFDDANGNGRRENDETGLSGRTVYLDVDNDGERSADEAFVTTGGAGQFAFRDLYPNTYIVRQETPGGREETRPSGGAWTVVLRSDEDRTGLEFGSLLTNYPPLAADDSYSTEVGEAIFMDVFSNDSDPDGKPLVYSLTQIYKAPDHGTVALNTVNNTLLYTPASGFVGTDTLQYGVIDEDGLQSEPATVTIQVTEAVGTAWQNPQQALDVNGDTYVSSIDALLILDSITLHGNRRLTLPDGSTSPPPYFDVSGDSYITPFDALMVLNEVNRIAFERRQAQLAEGELQASLFAAAVDQLWDDDEPFAERMLG